MAGNNKEFWTALGIIAGIVILWLIIENKNQKERILRLEEEIEKNKYLSKEIKDQLKRLISENPDINEDAKTELLQVIGLIEIHNNSKAAFTLAKIIENLFKQLYQDDESFRNFIKPKKNPAFVDYIEFAKKQGDIDQEEFLLLSLLRLYRNEEGHKLAVKKEKSKIESVFIVGIKLIVYLTRAIRVKKIII